MFLRRHPRLKRASPWIAWGAVLVLVLALAPGVGTVGVVAASAEMHEATVTAPRTARITKVAVKPGDAVDAGAVLVELDTASLDFELAIANAELERTKAGAVARELDLKGSDLDSAARLAQEAESATVDVAALLSEQKRDTAELTQVDELIAKQEKLVEQKLASAEQRDELKLRRASLAQRVAEYDGLLKAGRDHETATRDRLRAWRTAHEKDDKGGLPLEERVAPARAEVAAQEERVRQLQTLKEALALKAPIAGIVSNVVVSVGDTARQDAPLLSIVDSKPQRVVAYVDERAAPRVRLGEKVTMRPSDRSGPPREGIVAALAPGIAEVPPRFRVVPAQPTFGRAIYIELTPKDASGAVVNPPLPGQAFDVVFEGTVIGLRR
jgi:multidrug resistance efflux pump